MAGGAGAARAVRAGRGRRWHRHVLPLGGSAPGGESVGEGGILVANGALHRDWGRSVGGGRAGRAGGRGRGRGGGGLAPRALRGAAQPLQRVPVSRAARVAQRAEVLRGAGGGRWGVKGGAQRGKGGGRRGARARAPAARRRKAAPMRSFDGGGKTCTRQGRRRRARVACRSEERRTSRGVPQSTAAMGASDAIVTVAAGS